MDWFPEFILQHLNFTGKCYRHCDKPTSMKVISKEPGSLLGAYVCPDGFVSQVVYFSTKPDREYFLRTLTAEVGQEHLNPRDIRVASRHGWELGREAEKALRSKLGEAGVIHELYWTRYPRTDAEKLMVVSLCTGDGAKAGCLRLFMHARSSIEKFCPSCKAKNA
jgi:hypothetical protein